MEWSISKVDYPADVDPEATEILLGLDAGLDGSYGRTYLVRHEGALKALHRGGMVGAFALAELDPSSPPRMEPGKWGGEQLVLNVTDGDEKRLTITHHERDATLDVLEAIYRAGEPGPELAALLEVRQATTHDDEVKTATLLELARLYVDKDTHDERAVAHLQALLDLHPDHPEAFELLTELMEDGSMAACATLEEVYVRLRRHEPLAEVLLQRAHHEPDRRRELELEAAKLLEREVHAPGRALDVVLAALARHPDDAHLLRYADELLPRANAWAVAAAGFRAAEQATTDAALDAEFLWRIGSCHKSAGDLEAATQAMQELTWLVPKHREALGELVGLFAEQERFKSQLEALDELVKIAVDDRERIGWLHKAAHTREHHTGDVQGAIATHMDVLMRDAHNDVSLEALAGLYEATSRWADMVAALDKRAERAGVDKRSQLLALAARVTEDHLDDEETAMRRWRGALNALPSHVEAMEALTRLFEKHNRHLELVNALEQHAIGVDGDRAVAALKQAARISEDRVRDTGRAISCYERARELAPDDVEILRPLLRAYEQGAATEPVIDVLTHLLSLSTDPEDKLALLIQRAETHRRSDALDLAARDLDTALGMRPSDVGERVRLTLLKGDIELVIEPAEARATFEAALDLDPQNREAFERVEPLIKQENDPSSLASLYERRAGFVPEESSQWLCRAAQIHAEQLEAPERATELVLRALAADWQSEPVVAALCKVATHPNTWKSTFDVLEKRHKALTHGQHLRHGRLIDKFIDACRKNAVLDKDDVILRAARHFEKARGAPKRALKLYQRAYRRNREANDVDQRIRHLLRHLERHTDLAEHLREVADDGVYEGDEQRHLLEELANTLVAADRIEEAEAIRRQLARPTIIAVSLGLLAVSLGALLYFFLARAS